MKKNHKIQRTIKKIKNVWICVNLLGIDGTTSTRGVAEVDVARWEIRKGSPSEITGGGRVVGW